MQAADPNSRDAASSSILHPGHSGWHKAAPFTRCWAWPGTYYDQCQKQNWHVRLRFSSFGVSQYDWGGKLFIIQSVWGVPRKSGAHRQARGAYADVDSPGPTGPAQSPLISTSHRKVLAPTVGRAAAGGLV